ncbi:hypothetical protein [Ruminococcus sp. JL13D9]|jgi:hypothetical protein|uniref:hypothetical protein n=1 Tax=Ruminococcus sp. JL13D9 TaxID=3233381 RepID=UPI00389AC713|nr:hypothetical protein [Ruminococcus sp.]
MCSFFTKSVIDLEYRLSKSQGKYQNFYDIEISDNKKIVRKIPDMGGDGENLGKLVDLLNELQPEPSQLDYIIEDYLTFFDV